MTKRRRSNVNRFVEKHKCPWPDCKVIVSSARWGCRRHWFKLTMEQKQDWLIKMEDLKEYTRHSEECELVQRGKMSGLAQLTMEQVVGYPRCTCNLEQIRKEIISKEEKIKEARKLAIELRNELASLVYLDEEELIEFKNSIEEPEDFSDWADKLTEKAHQIVGLLYQKEQNETDAGLPTHKT